MRKHHTVLNFETIVEVKGDKKGNPQVNRLKGEDHSCQFMYPFQFVVRGRCNGQQQEVRRDGRVEL